MDARTIAAKAGDLQKAASASPDSAVLIELLNELKRGVKASEEILRSTKIGVVVNRFKQNKNPEVAKAASDLVRKWRDEVEKEKQSRAGGTAANGKAKSGGGGTPGSGTASPAAGKNREAGVKAKEGGKGGDGKKGEEGGSGVAPDKRSWKTDKVDIYRTGSKGRDACVGLIYDGLVFLSTTPATTVLNIALAVEEAAYKNLQPETSAAYKDKMRMLFSNLKNKSNPGLRARVLHGEITPEKLVNMTHDQLKSRDQKEEEHKIKEEVMREAEMATQKQAISETFVCPKCGQKKVAYSQAQTRSADEPMTTFCTCTVCGKQWRFS